MDLLAILVEEHTTLVLRVLGILHDIDVAVILELTLLLTSSLFVFITTAVPETAVDFTNGILLVESGQGVFNVPTTRTLEGMGVHFRPRYSFTFGGGEETDNSIPVARSVNLWFPETLINVLAAG
jgi:hypothetical protein